MHFRLLTDDDIPFGLHLSTQAGWNQLPADWQRALELQPEGCFVAQADGQPVGTIAVCCFGSVAWIALVLVEQSRRGQGLGTALMHHALQHLHQRGIRSIWLDATALGKPLYEKLGFVEETTFLRYQGIPQPSLTFGLANVRLLLDEDLAQVLALDRQVYGYDRARLLRRLFQEHKEHALGMFQGDQLRGFLFSRPGAKARLLGPCVAMPDAGMLLLQGALHRFAGQPLFVDVPACNANAQGLLTQQGFQIQRPLVRMRLGAQIPMEWSRIWSSSGPEKG